MTRDDVVRITESVLKELRLEVRYRCVSIGMPSTKSVELKYKDIVISSVEINA